MRLGGTILALLCVILPQEVWHPVWYRGDFFFHGHGGQRELLRNHPCVLWGQDGTWVLAVFRIRDVMGTKLSEELSPCQEGSKAGE